jgi:hypothetical protein
MAMAAFYLKGVALPHVTLNQIFIGMMPFMAILHHQTIKIPLNPPFTKGDNYLSLEQRKELPLFGRRPIGPPSGAEAPLGRRLARRAKRGDLPARSPALRDEGRGEIF